MLRSVPNVTRHLCACSGCAGRDGGVRDGGTARQEHSDFSKWRICALLGRKGPSVNACEHSQCRAEMKTGHGVPSMQLWLQQI